LVNKGFLRKKSPAFFLAIVKPLRCDLRHSGKPGGKTCKMSDPYAKINL